VIGRFIKPILIITGVATASVVVGVFAPAMLLNELFAQAPTDAVSLAVTQHWALLVFCIGALIVYAAYHPELRKPVLVAAIVEKIALVLGILFFALPLKSGAYAVAASDATFATLYLLYLDGL
jgi:hypothetical protein